MLRSPPLFLLWPRWRAVVNAPRSRDGRSLTRLLLFGALGLAFVALGFFGARWMFFKFAQVEYLAELLIRRVLSIVLLFFSGLLVFSSLITAFSSFYLADDLPLLVTSPISVRRLYLARFAETWAQASWMMLVFALPIAAGCGPVLEAPPWFYPLLFALMLPLTLLCAAAGTSGAMLLAWLLPARRTQDVLVVLALLAFLVLYVAFRLAEPEKFLDPAGFEKLLGLIGSLKGGGVASTPADWYVTALFGWLRIGSGPGDVAAALLPTVVLFSAALSAVFGGAWLADAIYLRSYSLSQEGRTGEEQSRLERLVRGLRAVGRDAAGRRRPPRYAATPLGALLRRDTRVFFRTTSQWTQLLLIAALVVVYIFNFKHFRTLMEAGQIGPTFLFFLNYLLTVFVVTTLAARFLYPAVSLEGRAYWAVQAAPVSARDLVTAKIRWGLGPLLVVSSALSVGSGLLSGAGPGGAAAVGALAALSTWALTGMAVGMGAADPRFHEDNPARIASSVGGVLFMLLGLAYLVVMVLLLVWPVNALSFWLDSGYAPRPGRLVLYAGLVVAALVLSIAAHVIPRRRGSARLAAREG